ncbi:MAG TPA: hypothetical protein DHV25_04635 [Candidatus Kerfeldbacteria bacterium]|nr:hypothetical protein [Candidatus Kerfeldbacteria bacterium]
MKERREKIIELKPNASGIYEAVGEVYREPKEKEVKKEARPQLQRKSAVPIHNEKIQSTLEGMQAGLAIFKALKNLLR